MGALILHGKEMLLIAGVEDFVRSLILSTHMKTVFQQNAIRLQYSMSFVVSLLLVSVDLR